MINREHSARQIIVRDLISFDDALVEPNAVICHDRQLQ